MCKLNFFISKITISFCAIFIFKVQIFKPIFNYLNCLNILLVIAMQPEGKSLNFWVDTPPDFENPGKIFLNLTDQK